MAYLTFMKLESVYGRVDREVLRQLREIYEIGSRVLSGIKNP